jgi:hypothetical protein
MNVAIPAKCAFIVFLGSHLHLPFVIGISTVTLLAPSQICEGEESTTLNKIGGWLAISNTFQNIRSDLLITVPRRNPHFLCQMAPLTAFACLEDYRIQGLPSSAFYISEFISETEEQVLLDKVRD